MRKQLNFVVVVVVAVAVVVVDDDVISNAVKFEVEIDYF